MHFIWHEYVYLKLKVEDSYFDGTKVRLYVPQNKDDRRAGILFVHGGGWMICSIVRLYLFILFLYWLHLEQKYLELTVEFKIIHVRIKLEMLPASLLFLLLGFLSGGLSIYSHVYFLRNIWFYRLVIYNVYLFSIQRHTITLFPKLQEDWMSWLFPSSKWTAINCY